MSVLEKFLVEEFTPTNECAAVTFARDVSVTLVEPDDSDILPWAIVINNQEDLQLLRAARLKWFMDVDEMFYLGEEHTGTGVSIKGLLSEAFRNPDGTDKLMKPVAYAKAMLALEIRPEEARPCKWVGFAKLRGRKSNLFTYNRGDLLFKLSWPRVKMLNGLQCLVGGIAPLALGGA